MIYLTYNSSLIESIQEKLYKKDFIHIALTGEKCGGREAK
jgi:hypothetical protein